MMGLFVSLFFRLVFFAAGPALLRVSVIRLCALFKYGLLNSAYFSFTSSFSNGSEFE